MNIEKYYLIFKLTFFISITFLQGVFVYVWVNNIFGSLAILGFIFSTFSAIGTYKQLTKR